VDVVVVGAGPGGLYAASLLQRTGREVVVLEARGRVGGRLLSVEAGAGHLDLGASWYWPGEQRVDTVVRMLGLATFPQHLDGDMIYQPVGDVQRITGNQLDVPSSRFEQGAQAIATGLAARLPEDTVRLADPVHAITTTTDRVEIDAEHSRWSAPHVVVAVAPATAVRAIHIAALASPIRALAAATPVWMGGTVKVVAHYERPFWRDRGLAGSAFSHVGPLREIHDMSGRGGHPAALFGFAQPAPGRPPPSRDETLDQLRVLFGDPAAGPQQLWIHDWRAEPATAHPDALGLTDYRTYGHDRYQRPALEGRLHWASTETAPLAPGHIEGALAAAERAVAAIVADRPTTPE
jgi:monoamine oxidase